MEFVALDGLRFPTERHEQYVRQAASCCQSRGLFLAVGGSIRQRTASVYSDVNLIGAGEFDRQTVEILVTAYGRPVMTHVSRDGIHCVMYEDGLAAEWDLRSAYSRDELLRIEIVAGDGKYPVTDAVGPRFFVRSLLFPPRNQAYHALCLLRKGVDKYLGSRPGVAGEYLAEAVEIAEDLGAEIASGWPFRQTAEEILRQIGPDAGADRAFLTVLQTRLDLIS